MRKHKQIITRTLVTLLALAAPAALRAQSGAYFTAVTNLNPVIYLPLTETVQPPSSKPAAANLGSLGAADNGTYTDGAFPGAPGALTGDSDTAGLFSGASGVNPRVSAPYDSGYASVTNFTVELWLNAALTDPPESSPINCLDTGSPRAGWLIYVDTTGPGQINFRTYATNGTSTSVNYVMNVPGGHILSNAWYHVVVSFNGATGVSQGYINGVAQAASTGGTIVGSTAGPFAIGARGDSSFAFPGFIDEVAFYSNVLGAADVSNHYAAGVSGPAGAYHTLVTADNPLLYYRLDDAAAPVAKNYGSAGAFANGYYESGTTPGGAGPAVPGMGGANSFAVGFNAGQSGDIGVSVPVVGAAGLPLGDTSTNPITLAMWVQANAPGYFTTVAGKGDQSYRFDINQTSGAPHWNAGNVNEIVGGDDPADDNWHFWAGTWDGSNIEQLYIDGLLVGQSTGNAGPNGNSDPFLIGTAPDDTQRNFHGSVCQVAVFPEALTSAQIQSLYFSAAGEPPTLTSSPQDTVVIATSNATLSVTAAGTQPLTYQWYNGFPSPSTVVAGATNNTLPFVNAQAASDGSYYVVVTDKNGLATTNTQAALLTVLTTALPGSYFSSVLALNPLAYWPLNETNQPPAYDDYAINIGTLGAAGNAFYSGTIQYQQTGALADTNVNDTNYSILTDGSTASVNLPYSLALSNQPPFTVEAWLQTGAPGTEQCALACVDANNPRSGWLLYMDATASGVWNFRTYNKNGTATANGSAGISAATTVTGGTWHYLAVVVTTNGNPVPNSSGIYPAASITTTMYLDGQETATTNAASYAMNDSGSFSIGGRSDGGFLFAGYEDEVAYYPSALSSNTIAAHYAAGTNTTLAVPYYQLVQQSSPLLFYQLDEAPPSYQNENSDPVATNYGVNGANDNGFYLPGSAPGAVAGPSVAGFPGTGSNNVAVAFSHYFGNSTPASGYVDVPSGGSDLNIRGPMTMAAWIKPVPNDDRFETFAGHSDNGYRMDIDTSMDLHYADANSAGDLTGSAINDGNWHFVVGTYDGTNEYLYIDGLTNATQPATGLATGSGDDFTIGVDPQYVTSRMFDGDVSQVALFTYALSGPQVLSLFYSAEEAPRFTQEPPATQTIGNGASGTITAAAYGTPALGYEWLKGNSPVSGPEFSGANTDALTINNAAPSDAGSYSLVVTNNYGAVTSSVVAVTISQVPVIIPGLSPTNHVLVGTTLTLSVGEIGTLPFTNAWYLNGVLLTNGGSVSGATTTTLTISNAGASDVGAYVFWVTNAFGSTNSSGYVIVDSEPTLDNNGAGWTLTDNAISAGQGVVSNNVITMTDGKNGEITSFFFDTPMWIHAFKASFTYQDVGGAGGSNATADGLTFCIQTTATGSNVLETGGGGSGLGYYQMSNSIALCAELYNTGTPLDNAPGIDIATNGQGSTGTGVAGGFIYGSTGSVSLISGDPINFNIYYDGSNYDVTMTDATTAATFTTNYGVGPIWESGILGSDTAYIGFTAATGGVSAVQTIANFYFTPIISLSSAPTITVTNSSLSLSWPVGVGGYTLYESSTLNSSNWTAVPGPYTIVSNQYQYIVSPLTGTEFYKLGVTP